MTRKMEIVEIEIAEDTVLLAEVLVSNEVSDVTAWRRLRPENIQDSIKTIVKWAMDGVREAVPEQPDKLGVEFGLKLTAQSGKLTSVLAQASGDASIVVRVEWNRSKTTP